MMNQNTLLHYGLLLSLLFSSCGGDSPIDDEENEPEGDIPAATLPDYTPARSLAFPGADGGGAATKGGATGKVYVVSRLDDDFSQGSLRYALSQSGPRTIVFSVGGTIHLTRKLSISNGDVTVAGQTAPGDGITLADYPVTIDANQVVLRFLRFRMGDVTATEDDALSSSHHDGKEKSNIIIDHCSVSWSTDECASFYGNENFTLQYCLIAESLTNSVHEKGTHGYGGIWGGKNASFHHNLLAHHTSRNPRFDHDYVSTMPGPIDYVNNVVYNWKSFSGYGGESKPGNVRHINMVNNYYKAGPGTNSNRRNTLFEWSAYCTNCISGGQATPALLYVNGNSMNGTANYDWQGVIAEHSKSWSGTLAAVTSSSKLTAPYTEGLTALNLTETADEAYASVLNHAGASRVRDAVDLRVVRNVREGSYDYEGCKGSTGGFIDSQSDVGGWPELSAGTPWVDTDQDGMPDDWEKANGLNPEKDESDKYNLSARYTNLEVYMNELVVECFPAAAGAAETRPKQ